MSSRVKCNTAQNAINRLVQYIREHVEDGVVYVWTGLPMEEVLEKASERFRFVPLSDMEAPDQWMVSTIQALNAYSDQKEMLARKTAVEAWNSRSVRSILFMVWRETLRAHTSISTKEAKKRQTQHLGLGASQADQYRQEENGYETILQVLQQARFTSFSEEEVTVFLMAMSS